MCLTQIKVLLFKGKQKLLKDSLACLNHVLPLKTFTKNFRNNFFWVLGLDLKATHVGQDSTA